MTIPYQLPSNVITESSVFAVEPSAADEFLSTASDITRCSIVNDGEKSFKLNGRTYYQGIIFGDGRYNSGAELSFNVEGISKLSFSLGHVDNSDSASTEISVYVDNILEDKFVLSQNSDILQYDLDVSDAKTVRIHKTGSRSRYAIADISYDAFRISSYDGISSATFFKMNGRTYYQGVTFSGSWNQNASVSYNVENLYSVSFKIGHIDGSGDNSGIMTIFHNGSEIGNIELTPSMATQTLTIETYDLSTIRFVTNFENSASYGIADFSVVEAEKRVESDLPLPPEPPVIIVLPTADAADVNDDGIVSVCDFIRLVKRVLSGKSDANDKAFDINDDGKVDSADALLLKTFLMN